ncbi:Acetyltransferase involved in cellulose biosynthesis, CelD/BcsL family [Actinacidiphila alni]|uniref:Acetyltransferase involved in cellulose biosynthesis, CelD/BcsL family n=1 Tax=Actinacidiphila alni TaxID=380248 RepID=A0A1I2LBC9_9ACTN|nr:GNAT family N-acetyltransferase [Actinacidiphila alni]SFF74501.1 Acetyltransferase involved in cellulose biosynthesis, CelD/BcsL family [Actinacidiphila alni]
MTHFPGLYPTGPASAPPSTATEPTPFHTAQWTSAWGQVTTELFTDRHVMRWPVDGAVSHLPYYRTVHSPLWTAMEGDAELPGPVWRGRPVTYARSLYGEYGGLPAAPPGVLAHALDRGLDLARTWDTPALVVPNLTTNEAARWTAVRRADAVVVPYWAHRIDLPDGGGIDAFVVADQTRRRSRRDLRRQWRRGHEAGLRAEVLHGRDMLPVLPDIVRHARETSQRHGPALYGMDMLQPVADVPGALAIVAQHPTGLAGAFVCFRRGDTLYLWTAAVDQARKRALSTYAWLMYTSLAHACDTGASVVDAGRGNYRYKAQLGLQARPLASLVYLTRPDRPLIERLEQMHQGLDSHAHRAWARTARAA